MNDPKIEIVTYTGQWAHHDDDIANQEFAARLLAFTKNTRLQMTPDGFSKFLTMPWEEIEKELDYMATTIPSSWEFVDVTFAIRDVSRACAQQITRTRFTPMDADIFGSYAMQSQRVTDMSEVTFHIPKTVEDGDWYWIWMNESIERYKSAISKGISLEDARGLLPMNVHCNLIAKYNLRQLVEMLRARDSLRVQGEYQEVARQMKAEVLRIWPWSAPFFVPKDKQAITMIEEIAHKLRRYDVIDGKELSNQLAKAADLLKKG